MRDLLKWVVYTVIMSIFIMYRPIYVKSVSQKESRASDVCKNSMYRKNPILFCTHPGLTGVSSAK